MSDNSNNNTSPHLPPAGWYPDPHDARDPLGKVVQRYWDGTQWTEHTAVPTGSDAVPTQVMAPLMQAAEIRSETGPQAAGLPAGPGDSTGAGVIAVPARRGLPKLKWWQWALIAFGVLVLISVIAGALGGGHRDGAAATPTPTVKAQEVDAPEPKPVDDREEMPGLVGLTVAEARAAVEAAGFVIAMPVGTGDDWVVLTQTISDGRQADPGTEVLITAEAPKPMYTLAQQNAIGKAQSYLDFAGFSRSGLIDQLEYEGYSTEDATFGADNAGADWNAEAAEKAASYLEFTSFSRQGLYDQLAYEGFTDAEIQFGLAAVGY